MMSWLGEQINKEKVQLEIKNSRKELIENGYTAKGYKISIIVAEWNSDITRNLLQGAVIDLLKNGVLQKDIEIIVVPGSFELIFGAKIGSKNKPDAIICLGCIIKGDTEHFHYVSSAVSNGIKDLNISLDIPVIFGVLTDNNHEQSIDRSGGKHGNKGSEAAESALKMVKLNKK